MAFRTTYSTTIRAPVGRVFALVEDGEQAKLWRTGLLSSERTREVPGGVGSTFRERIQEGGRVVEYDGEVTAFAPNRELGVRVGNRHFAADVVYQFSSEAAADREATRLAYTCDTTIHSAAVRLLIGWYVKWFSRRMLVRMMDRLKAAAEAN